MAALGRAATALGSAATDRQTLQSNLTSHLLLQAQRKTIAALPAIVRRCASGSPRQCSRGAGYRHKGGTRCAPFFEMNLAKSGYVDGHLIRNGWRRALRARKDTLPERGHAVLTCDFLALRLTDSADTPRKTGDALRCSSKSCASSRTTADAAEETALVSRRHMRDAAFFHYPPTTTSGISSNN